MAVQLFKLLLTGTTTTAAKPTALRYFGKSPSAYSTTNEITLGIANFVGDDGTQPAEFTAAAANNGYYQLYVDGQLQQASLYTVSTSNIVLASTAGHTKIISLSAPITLVTTNFAPSSSTTITG